VVARRGFVWLGVHFSTYRNPVKPFSYGLQKISRHDLHLIYGFVWPWLIDRRVIWSLSSLALASLGPLSRWSPVSLVPCLAGPLSRWSLVSLGPLSRWGPCLAGALSRWSPVSLVPCLAGPWLIDTHKKSRSVAGLFLIPENFNDRWSASITLLADVRPTFHNR
jgi:hypothetical protein